MSNLMNKPRKLKDRYFIWSREHRGWWRANGGGYAGNHIDAGYFTFDSAVNICRNANKYSEEPQEVMVHAQKYLRQR